MSLDEYYGQRIQRLEIILQVMADALIETKPLWDRSTLRGKASYALGLHEELKK